jgi:hypothetical protein
MSYKEYKELNESFGGMSITLGLGNTGFRSEAIDVPKAKKTMVRPGVNVEEKPEFEEEDVDIEDVDDDDDDDEEFSDEEEEFDDEDDHGDEEEEFDDEEEEFDDDEVVDDDEEVVKKKPMMLPRKPAIGRPDMGVSMMKKKPGCTCKCHDEKNMKKKCGKMMKKKMGKCSDKSNLEHKKKKVLKKEHFDFLNKLYNQAGMTKFAINKDGSFKEDAVYPEEDPNAAIRNDEPGPGEVGYAPQSKVGGPLGSSFFEWSQKKKRK